MSLSDENDFEEEEIEEIEEPVKEPKKKVQSAPKKADTLPHIIGGGRAKNVALDTQMQVVLVKPDRYEDARDIADHLNARKTVVLNLEAADKDTARRIVDFLSGAAYANGGNMRKVARATLLFVPAGVDMMGEVMLDGFEETSMYFGV